MKNIFFIGSIVLILCSAYLFANKQYIVKIDNSAKSYLYVATINDCEYVDLLSISRILIPESKPDLKKFKISLESGELTFSPSSVFIAYRKDDGVQSLQMLKPAIFVGRKLYVPLNSFLISLESFNFYKVDVNDINIELIDFNTKLEITEKKNKTINSIENELLSELAEKDSDTTDDKFLSDDLEKMSIVNSEEIIEKIGNEPDSEIKELSVIREEEEINTNGKVNIGHNVFAGTPEHVNYTPNVYVLPSNLDVGELAKNDVEGYDLIANIDNETTIALINEDEYEVKTEFVKIYAEQKADYTEIHLYANSIIEEYHKPECIGRSMTIRLPYAVDKITDYSLTNNIYPLSEITNEKIRQFLLYKIEMSDDIRQCTSRRNGPKELIFTVFPVHPKPVEKPKTIAVEASIDEPKKEISENNKKPVINLESEKKKWELDCIVLDPGHGGKDAGAVGVTGVYEKDITLKLARQVKELLAVEMPDTKVVLTRTDDRFVQLYKRGQIANKAGGKLFISIHLNSARKKPSSATGLETFILRPGKNDDAVRVANFENSVIKFEKQQDKYKKLTDEELIIATMAQSAFVKFSELFARHMQEEVLKTTNMKDRGVKQAGFYVLIGASMPNVLFEAGFLSNREEEKYANSAEGQEKTARGIVNAIKKYAKEYKKY